MSVRNRLTEVFNSSQEIPFDNSSKFILFSDCHRGYGDSRDEFKDNGALFLKKLTDFYDGGFTYIEVGDGDELWRNRQFEKIAEKYTDIFRLMREYHGRKRLYLIIGNHDGRKADPQIIRQWSGEDPAKPIPIFDTLKTHEGLVLKHLPTGKKIFITHGHQGDTFCDTLSPMSRVIVNTPIWDILEYIDFDNKISPAKNKEKRRLLVTEYRQWAELTGHILICGHTHQACFPRKGEPSYWNTGSWVEKDTITGIAIENGAISLIAWNNGSGGFEPLGTLPLGK